MLLAVALAGCGGGKKAPDPPRTQTVRGTGFSFVGPAAWRVARAAGRLTLAPAGDDTTLVSVQRYRLLKLYRPAIFAAAARELDARTDALARLRHGRVTARRTTRVAGLRVRAYDLRAGDVLQRLAYVLRGHDEYLLTCQYARGRDDPAGACARLLASFRLTAPPA